MATFVYPINISILISTIILAGIIAAAVTEPVITPWLDISKRQTTSSGGLIGYINEGGSWDTYYCFAGATFSEWESWARCCSTDTVACDFPTACSGSTIFLQVDTTTCDELCSTLLIYEYLNAPTAAFTGYGCINFDAPVYLNTISSTYSSPSASATSSSSNPSPSPSSSSVPSTLSATSQASFSLSSSISPTSAVDTSETGGSSPTGTGGSSSTNQPQSSSSSSKSKAWIAGAVIGPVFGVTILGLAFWIYRLRKQKLLNQQRNPATGTTSSFTDPYYNPAIPVEVPSISSQQIRPELPAVPPVSELSSSRGYYR